jgi:hypothetical protein
LRDKFWKAIDDAIDCIEIYPERHHYDPSGRRLSNLEGFHTIFCLRSVFSTIGPW